MIFVDSSVWIDYFNVIIATFCIENNLPLLHGDKDFRATEEHLALKVVS